MSRINKLSQDLAANFKNQGVNVTVLGPGSLKHTKNPVEINQDKYALNTSRHIKTGDLTGAIVRRREVVCLKLILTF